MSSEKDVPVLAADLVDAIERHVRADPRIVTAHVQGFPPDRFGDLYADVILYLGCDSKESCKTILDDLIGWLAPVTRIVLAMRDLGVGFPSMRNCVTDDGIRLDVQAHDAAFARARPIGRILKETPGHYQSDAAPAQTSPPGAWEILDKIERFWCTFALIGRAIQRDAVLFGYFAYLQLYRDAFNLLARRGPTRAKSPFQNAVLSDDDDRLLTSTVRFETLTPETLAREYLKLGEIVAAHGPTICEMAEAKYPLALQQAVMRRVRNELRMHGIPC